MANFATNFANGAFGDITVTSLTATGNIQGAIVRGTTALEYPAGGVGVRCTDDTDVGIGRTAANQLTLSGSVAVLIPSPTTITGALAMDGDIVLGSGRTVNLDRSSSTTDCPLQWNGDSNTGISWPGSDDYWRFVMGGSAIAQFGTSGPQMFSFLYCDAGIGLQESSAPGAIANYSVLYSLDVAGKTQFTAKQGAVGTVVPLALEV